jgi:AbrB family looped-hinge helix DNA binding protein
MGSPSVTSKGQVTIPLAVRQQLGIRKGSQLSFIVKGEHAELHVVQSPEPVQTSRFGMLKSRTSKPVPADFDPASLLKPRL